jgi:fructosamine-3-kinase
VCLETLELDPTERADVDAQLADILGELHSHEGARWGRVDIDEGFSSWADLVVARLVDVRAQPTIAERLAPDVLAGIDHAIGIVRTALGDPGRPTLVHGDVWDGNVMVDREGGRWRITGLLDPSLQFADAEFELAYLEVFDNSREPFFAAYQRPIRPGYEQRRLFYWLHTALVHVALFGDEFFGEFTARTAEQIGRGEPARDGV